MLVGVQIHLSVPVQAFVLDMKVNALLLYRVVVLCLYTENTSFRWVYRVRNKVFG